MITSSKQPAYQPRRIDDDITEAARHWLEKPEPGYEKAAIICLRSEQHRGNSRLLAHAAETLHQMGFQPLLIDPAAKNQSLVPNSLSIALHRELAKYRSYNLKPGLHKLLYGSKWSLLQQLALYLTVFTLYLAYSYSTDKSFAPPYLHNFVYIFFLPNFLKIVFLGFFGGATSLAIVFSVLFPKSRPFDEKAEAEFANPEGYFRALARVCRRKPLALLVDNSSAIDLGLEMEVINTLLGLTPNDDLPRGLPGNFRVLAITLGQPRMLRLNGKYPEYLTVPKLRLSAQDEVDEQSTKVKHEIDAYLVAAAPKRRNGVLGVHEWVAYEAAMDRQSITQEELQARYKAVRSSDLLLQLGLTGPHPTRPPATILREKHRTSGELVYKPFYREQALRFYEKHHQNLLAKAELMLAIPGIACLRNETHWRTWSPATLREVVYAAEYAENLADRDKQGDFLLKLLEGDMDAKRKTILDLLELLLVASEIQVVRGHLLRAIDFLQSATNWYAAVEDKMPEQLQSRLFYALWTSFWLSCELEQRAAIRAFEAKHPKVSETNTWKILNNRELRLMGNPLVTGLVDPGATFPELANVFQFTEFKDRIIRLHGDDFEEAAKSETFDLGTHYPEQFATSFGIKLLSIQSQILKKRGAGEPLKKEIDEITTEMLATVRRDWIGDRLMLELDQANDLINNTWRERLSWDPTVQTETQNRYLAKFHEIRDLASVLGFRWTAMSAAYTLGWIYLMRSKDSPSLEELAPLPEAERYFQSVLDIEDSLGWVNWKVDILCRRYVLLQATNLDALVDNQISLYYAVNQAGYPLTEQLEWLEQACTTVVNHGRTRTHTEQKAILHEIAADLTDSGQRGSNFWRANGLEEESAGLLQFAISARRSLGQLEEAVRLLNKAKESLEKAEALRPGNDTIREGWVSLWSEESQIDKKLKNEESMRELLARCWTSARASDVQASYIFRLVMVDESESGILETEWPRDISGNLQKDSTCEDFSVSRETLAQLPGRITRLEWRLLQFHAAAPLLRKANLPGFCTSVSRMAGLARSIAVSESSKSKLIELLIEAEQYYATDGASNSGQRECIDLILDLDPSKADLLKEKLDRLDLEDALLKEREASIAEIIENSGRQEELLLLDSTFLRRQTGERGDAYIDSCVHASQRAESLLSQKKYEEAAALADDYISKFQTSRILWVELRLFHLWLLALRFQPSESTGIQAKEKRFAEMVRSFLVQHFPSADSERLDQLGAALNQRLEELDISASLGQNLDTRPPVHAEAD